MLAQRIHNLIHIEQRTFFAIRILFSFHAVEVKAGCCGASLFLCLGRPYLVMKLRNDEDLGRKGCCRQEISTPEESKQ